MFDANFFILYVESPTRSAEFYKDLLGREPVEQSPTFAMFALPSGIMLGLWVKTGVVPAARGSGGGEIAWTVADAAAVEAAHADWKRRGVAIAQAPVGMDFGVTFVGLDPDGHRLRVFAPAAP